MKQCQDLDDNEHCAEAAKTMRAQLPHGMLHKYSCMACDAYTQCHYQQEDFSNR